jgi:hypothetical protein
LGANWFSELSSIDVGDHVRQKNGLNYLSWMWAWHELKKRYPLSYATVHETDDGMLVWKDPVGGHVKTSITIVWKEDGELKEHTTTEYLPVMDFKNKSVPYENIDSMLVNKTVQRSLTKCIARLGLGGYLFVNEDLPEESKVMNSLQTECLELIQKKCALSAATKEKVASICKEILVEEGGNPKLCEDNEKLKELKKKLMAVRKIPDKGE